MGDTTAITRSASDFILNKFSNIHVETGIYY